MTLLSSRRRRHHDDVVVAAVVAAAVNVYGLPMPVLITSMSVVTPAGSGHVWPCMYNRRSRCSVMNLHSSGQRSASTYETIIVYCSRILASAARAILPSTVRNLGCRLPSSYPRLRGNPLRQEVLSRRTLRKKNALMMIRPGDRLDG